MDDVLLELFVDLLAALIGCVSISSSFIGISLVLPKLENPSVLLPAKRARYLVINEYARSMAITNNRIGINIHNDGKFEEEFCAVQSFNSQHHIHRNIYSANIQGGEK